MPREGLGEFEHHVLLVILRLGGESYSMPIVLELQEVSGREVSAAAVFIALCRIEKTGLLTSRFDESDGEAAHSRRNFTLTPEALARLRASRRAFVRLWSGVAGTLDKAR